MKSFAVIGLGRFGSALACQLYKEGGDVLAIDIAQEPVDRIADEVTQAVAADATNREVMETLGVNEVDCAIVAAGSDLASSVLITMMLKTMGVPMIICKAHDDTHNAILEKLGADRIIIPEQSSAKKLATNLLFPNVLETLSLSSECAIVEVNAPEMWNGKMLKELAIRAKYHITVIAIRGANGKLIVSPGAEDMIQNGDKVVLLGTNDDLGKLRKIVHHN